MNYTRWWSGVHFEPSFGTDVFFRLVLKPLHGLRTVRGLIVNDCSFSGSWTTSEWFQFGKLKCYLFSPSVLFY
jgi:hypothetical protein